ncbi:GAF domain-containing protein [Effusibacillus pohliae]|uniref:GAF domain-containing protein n=1 Tax=Effusibacillus pohliae TaxID=232270 RepID=UPI00037D8E06|nr:GAF domain-containing protein [Effusibacillus pohliae]
MSFAFEQIAGTKPEFYRSLDQQLHHLLAGETDWLANLANAAALLWMQLEEINWAGFYLMKNGQLVLGPFQGKPACVRIPLGKGVCGTAAAKRETLMVPDVHRFPGHIACDAASRSEIVVPIVVDQLVVGVLDIDSPILARFDEEDRTGLEQYVETLKQHIDWSDILEHV